ncbi:MAG: hypothetical protein VW622_11120, partial [Opitutae bacterium]
MNDASFTTGAQDGFDSGGLPYWDITKNLKANSGKLVIDHHPFSAWDRVIVFQNNPASPIFDTGQWTTSSEADRFVVRYGPDRNTSFQFIPMDGNGNGAFDNKSRFLSHFGLPDDGSESGWETRKNNEYQNLGIVSTNQSVQSSTNLTIR